MARKSDKDELAEDIIRRNDALKSDRGTWDTLWQQIADYVMPRKSQITTKKTEDVTGFTDDLYNMTAIRSNQVLAAGQKDYLVSGQWFAFDAPAESEDDDAKTWFQRCTEITMRELARSNFYLEVHEMFLDRGAFGTACLFLEEGRKTLLNFKKFDVGTFSIAEDADGMVDTFFRDFEMTARQAYQRFGDMAGKCIREALTSDDPRKLDQKFPFVHAVFPREDSKRNRKKQDGPNKPIASIYVNVKDRCVCRNSGYDEHPLAVSRFLTWGESPYGYSPSIEALPTVRQVNFIEKQMDALAEVAAFPRMLIPEGLDGDVDLRAGGVTIFDPNTPNAVPKEWATQGRYDVGMERIKTKDEAIREAYHVDLFQMLKQIDAGKMTAYEVAQRVAEKVAAFSPTFSRLQTEVFNPVLLRVFGMLFRAGKFGDPPASVIVDNGGELELQLPEVTLTSKLALAIKAVENNAFLQMVQILAPIAELHPDILDNYDLDKVARGVGKNLAVPTAWQRPLAEVEAMRAERAKAQAAAQAAEQAPGVAKAARDISEASPSVRKAVMGGSR